MIARTSSVALVSSLLLAAVLTGCGAQGVSPLASGANAAFSAQGKKADAKKDEKADASRLAPPSAGEVKQPSQGLAARKAADYCADALYRYDGLLRDWNRAYSDYEKDRIEQRMLDLLHGALQDVQRVTSREGYDSADRRAYDLAGRCLDQYDRLYRDWKYAYTDREKREITNRMLVVMVDGLKDVRSNY